MAVCEIWDVRGRLDHPIDYAENPEKTANPKYTEADLDKLATKIIEGGKGVWGEIPMTPHSGMSKENAQKMVKYILTLKK